MIRVAIKFGAFVVVCLFFTGYLAFTIGNLDVRDPLGRDTYTLQATFDDVTGLLVNDNVKIAGVVIGKVTGIRVEAGRAVVDMAIDDDAPRHPESRHLGGDPLAQPHRPALRVPLPGRSRAAQRWCDGDEIGETTSVVDLGELFERLGPIVTAIDPTQVNDLLETLTRPSTAVRTTSARPSTTSPSWPRAWPARDEAIGRLIGNLDTVAATLDRRDGQIDAMIENLVTLAESFGDNTATLDAALTELGRFGTDLHGVLEGNRTEIDRLLGNLRPGHRHGRGTPARARRRSSPGSATPAPRSSGPATAASSSTRRSSAPSSARRPAARPAARRRSHPRAVGRPGPGLHAAPRRTAPRPSPRCCGR